MKPFLQMKVIIGIMCLALLVSACGEAVEPNGAGNAASPDETGEAIITPAPTQTSVPIDQTPVVPSGEPILYEIEAHLDQPPTPELLVDFSSYVAIGVVREHLEAQWTTPDGMRPETILNGDPSKTIFTPVVVELEQPPLMDLEGLSPEATSIIVLIEGGTIDEVTVQHTGSFYDLPVGQRVVLGALATTDPFIAGIYGEAFNHMLPEGHDVTWLPQTRFVIDDNGVSSDGERFAEDEFLSRLDTAIKERIARAQP
jgi:hypothetical protein